MSIDPPLDDRPPIVAEHLEGHGGLSGLDGEDTRSLVPLIDIKAICKYQGNL